MSDEDAARWNVDTQAVWAAEVGTVSVRRGGRAHRSGGDLHLPRSRQLAGGGARTPRATSTRATATRRSRCSSARSPSSTGPRPPPASRPAWPRSARRSSRSCHRATASSASAIPMAARTCCSRSSCRGSRSRRGSVTTADADAIEAEIGRGCQLLYLETPTNPTLKVVDIERLSRAAHRAGAIVVTDNTFATPSASARRRSAATSSSTARRNSSPATPTCSPGSSPAGRTSCTRSTTSARSPARRCTPRPRTRYCAA